MSTKELHESELISYMADSLAIENKNRPKDTNKQK
jgi:hypothetical protein